MRVMSDDESAAYEAKMAHVRKSMTPDIEAALVAVANWIGLPDSDFERFDRMACVNWVLQHRLGIR